MNFREAGVGQVVSQVTAITSIFDASSQEKCVRARSDDEGKKMAGTFLNSSEEGRPDENIAVQSPRLM